MAPFHTILLPICTLYWTRCGHKAYSVLHVLLILALHACAVLWHLALYACTVLWPPVVYLADADAQLALMAFFHILPTICLHYWVRYGHEAHSGPHLIIDFVLYACAVLWPPLFTLARYALWLAASYGPYALLGAELCFCLCLLPWLMRQSATYLRPPTSRVLTRAQLRHPVWNVFVKGLSAKGVLLSKFIPCSVARRQYLRVAVPTGTRFCATGFSNC